MKNADQTHPDSTQRKVLGAFYTPDAVVDYMIKQLSVANLSGRILEPSGGDGAIVKGLIRAGIHPDQVTAWDINPDVKADLEELEISVSIGDALAREPQAGAFHAVVGNPPYLNKQSDYIKQNRDWLKTKFTPIGAHDTYAMFAWLTFQHLAPGGQLVFLISDTFFSLGIHKKFRQWLLKNTRIDSLTLLPKHTFPGASVNTVILSITASPAPANHSIKVIDARASGIVKPPKPTLVPQAEVLKTPGSVFLVDKEDRADLAFAATLTSLMSVLDGGLGMFTRDNDKYLAVISDNGVPRTTPRKNQQVIPANKVDGKKWKAYHKRGGDTRWYAPVEHAVKWEKASRAKYTTPQSANDGGNSDGTFRQGIAVSGVASRLSARLATPGAMWESNKVFCLFPKNPAQHSPFFLLALLNSGLYNRLVSLMNHTVSLQIRDVRALPLLPFSQAEISQLAQLGEAAYKYAIEGNEDGLMAAEDLANAIVDGTWQRAMSAPETSRTGEIRQ